MTAVPLWQPNAFPRSMTRQEWLYRYRWIRTQRKIYYRRVQEFVLATADMRKVFPALSIRMADRITNPPMLLPPWGAL